LWLQGIYAPENDPEINIYNNDQSIHDPIIEASIFISIRNILPLSQKYTLNECLTQLSKDSKISYLSKKIIHHSCSHKVTHSALNATFSDVFSAVWNIIVNHKLSDNIKELLDANMLDARNTCFVGRIGRLISTLSTFDDNVNINISETQQLNAININIKRKLGMEYSPEAHRKLLIEELTYRKYSQEVIDEWLSYI
jgi:hypothetical protein